ncbi:MAG: hypothetical protein ACK4YP_13130 [Myxococcota bacterium]
MSQLFYLCGNRIVLCNPVIITDPDTWRPPWLTGRVFLPVLEEELANDTQTSLPDDLFSQIVRTAAYWKSVTTQLETALAYARPAPNARARVYSMFPERTRRPALVQVHGRVYAQIGTPTKGAEIPERRKALTPTEHRAAIAQVEAVLAQAKQLHTLAIRAEARAKAVDRPFLSHAALDAVRELQALQ